jgi:hypothetical protein
MGAITVLFPSVPSTRQWPRSFGSDVIQGNVDLVETDTPVKRVLWVIHGAGT